MSPRPAPAAAFAEIDDESPLLEGVEREEVHTGKEREGGGSILSLSAGLTNTLVGTGCLALPHAFASGGLIPGILTVLWCGATSAFGLYLLTRSATRAPHRAASFAELSKLTYPKLGRVFDAAIALKCIGVSCSYLWVRDGGMATILGSLLTHPSIVIGSLAPRVVYSFNSSAPEWALDRRLWILVAMTLLCPLAFLRKFDSLKVISYISLCTVANLVFVVIYKSVINTSGLPPKGPVDLVALGPKFVSSLPVQIFAFTCAQNIFPVYNELRSNTQARLNEVIGFSIGSAAVVYEILGVLGYLTFGSLVGSNIIEMYPHSLLVSICQLGLVILVLFSYPLQLFPARASLDKVLFPPSEDDRPAVGDHAAPDIPLARFIVESGFILCTTFTIAMFVSSLEVVLGFVGATGSTAISFILPAVFFLALFKDSSSPRDRLLRWLTWGLLVWGIVVMVVSMTLNIWHLVHPVEEGGSLALLGVLGGKHTPPA